MLENSVDEVDTAEGLLDDVDTIDLIEERVVNTELVLNEMTAVVGLELRLVVELVGLMEFSKLDPSDDVVTSGKSGILGEFEELVITRVVGRGKIGVGTVMLGKSVVSGTPGVSGM